jgi:hypothetical protein
MIEQAAMIWYWEQVVGIGVGVLMLIAIAVYWTVDFCKTERVNKNRRGKR